MVRVRVSQSLRLALGVLMLGLCACVNAGGEGSTVLKGATPVNVQAQEMRDRIQHVKDAPSRSALERFYALPDLLMLAKEKMGANGDPYPAQARLAKEYGDKKRAYRMSMPHRHLAECKSGEHSVAAVEYTLVDTAHTARVVVWEVDIHETLEHGVPLPAALIQFLNGVTP